jgi:hypothetical protein
VVPSSSPTKTQASPSSPSPYGQLVAQRPKQKADLPPDRGASAPLASIPTIPAESGLESPRSASTPPDISTTTQAEGGPPRTAELPLRLPAFRLFQQKAD